ncbi:MAG: hypothetical protein NT113_05580 [Hyphomicrobiales bacterium]|jgi:hypothetical protein|nr:hypothetical protein [Hyphomicrobiales bacterium]
MTIAGAGKLTVAEFLQAPLAVSITLNEIYDTLDVRPRTRLQVVKHL